MTKKYGKLVSQIFVLVSYLNLYFLKRVILKQFVTLQNENYYLIDPQKIKEAIWFFKKSYLNSFKSLLDIIVIDNGCKKKRFLIIFVLGNLELSSSAYVCTFVDDFENVKSVQKLYSSAEWLEREAWDLMGINFSMKNKKKILSDYSSSGHFLRKNFPKSGFYESKKQENIKINIKFRTKTLQKKSKKKTYC